MAGSGYRLSHIDIRGTLCLQSSKRKGRTVFTITAGKGFQITFENGFTASVQFGYGNYCENRAKREQIYYHGDTYSHDIASKNAEVAFWHKDQDGMDEPHGWVEPDAVAAFLLTSDQATGKSNGLPNRFHPGDRGIR